MRLAAVTVFAFSLATAAVAQLTPGYVVRTGVPFPIVADFNGDGLDDLIQECTVILNNGAALADEHDLGLAKGDRVIGILDVNGGDGTFERLKSVRIAASPQIVPDYRVLTGDLNHDGLPTW